MDRTELIEIEDNVKRVRERIQEAALRSGRNPEAVTLVAATKMNDASRVQAAIRGGVDACGENRVQELREKLEAGAYEGAPVHFIGHLQRNKLQHVVGACDLIQSGDSAALLREIDHRAGILGIRQDMLLEVNIGNEASKTGLDPAALPEILGLVGELSHIQVRGLMAIPPIFAAPEEARPVFARMQQLFVDIGQKKYNNVHMEILSMGMSGDYVEAILEGSTMVRVGTAIFGARNYAAQK
jgi:pyridoxal phosphate enzyme (YggS family)